MSLSDKNEIRRLGILDFLLVRCLRFSRYGLALLLAFLLLPARELENEKREMSSLLIECRVIFGGIERENRIGESVRYWNVVPVMIELEVKSIDSIMDPIVPRTGTVHVVD